MDKAKKDAAAELQAQADKEKNELASQQSLLQLSKDASTQLQSQLDSEKTRSTALQSQVDKDKAQLADMQTQINLANSGSSQLIRQLDQAKIQSMDLQARLQTAENDVAQLQPLLLKARHMPVTTSFEKVHGGRRFTLQIKNLYLQPLNVTVTVTGSGKESFAIQYNRRRRNAECRGAVRRRENRRRERRLRSGEFDRAVRKMPPKPSGQGPDVS